MSNRKHWVTRGLVLLASLVVCPPGEAPEATWPAAQPAEAVFFHSEFEEKRVTAKAELAKARQRARAWQPDATLVTIRAFGGVDAAGKVSSLTGWEYTFWSRKAEKVLFVTPHFGRIDAREDDEESGGYEPIPEEFMDSDAAMAAAIRSGYKPLGDETTMELHNSEITLSPATEGEAPKEVPKSLWWKITRIGSDAYFIGGKTGKFLGKLRLEPD